MTDPNHPHAPSGTETEGFRLSRGTLLRGAAGAMVGMSPLLAAACGGSGGGGSGCPRDIQCLDVWQPVICADGIVYSNSCYAYRACAPGPCVSYGGDAS